MVYFEDFAVGQIFSAGPETVDAAEAIAFSKRFDPQLQHVDAEAAKESVFGELVLSGWHTAGIAMAQKLTTPLGAVHKGLVGGGVEAMRWHLPVRPGDALRTTITITNTRLSNSRPDKGVVQYTLESFNQRDERVLSMQITVLMPRRNAA